MTQSSAIEALANAQWNYSDVGATTGELPLGYHHVHQERLLGDGRATFDSAATQLLTWDLHRRSGLTVRAATPTAAQGVNVLLGFG